LNQVTATELINIAKTSFDWILSVTDNSEFIPDECGVTYKTVEAIM